MKYQWKLPTIVLAFEDEGAALAQAWEMGALAGWIWNNLPKNPIHALFKIDAQYKRNQDSRDLPSAAALQKRLLPNPISLPNYEVESFFNLRLIYQVIGMIIGNSMNMKCCFI